MIGARTPSGDRIPDDGGPIGLALSGGGVKAAVFHIGVLARLAELDLLRRIDVISGTSGGALIAALYHLRLKRALDADGDVDSDRLIRIVAAVERDFLTAVQTDLGAKLFENPLINLKRMAARHSSASRFADLLHRHLFLPLWSGDRKRPIEMRDLAIHPRGDLAFNPTIDNPMRYCKAPSLIVNAANLDTGRAWRFDVERMGEPAADPTTRRSNKAPLFTENPYRHLPDAHAGLTLGHAVAASMAAPGLLEPLRLRRLYPDPAQPSRRLDVRLVDGRLADALGTDALLERGCGRLIVSDASGFERSPGARTDRAKTLQLEALEAKRPGGVVLIHMLSEIEAPEIKPSGAVGHGHVAKDRFDRDATSYGVERRLQKLIAGMRANLDAPSELEAMSLMADGYLIAKRAFQLQRLRAQSWTDAPSTTAWTWRFAAIIEALRQPPGRLVRHLATAGQASIKAERLTIGEAFGLGLLALVAALTLVALTAFWLAIRPQTGADRLWVATTIGLLMMASWLAGRRFGRDERLGSAAGWMHAAVTWIDKAWTLLTALPLALGARFRHRLSRASLKAGRLKTIGIKLIVTKKQADETVSQQAPAEKAERKAA
ncbi:MAG: patatin-like phospholipase family protein [Alphaproteobacteria bacterium]|nr:patatin-like phospholipase family protein [Alphaproteobacteria bacterium]